MVQNLKFVKYTFYHRNNFGTKILIVFHVCMKNVSYIHVVCASWTVQNRKYMYVCTILIFLLINYVVIEWIIHVKLRYGINFRTSCGQVPTSCSEVAERFPISRRPIAHKPPASFSDSHALILTKLVSDWSATDRGLVGDFAGTCLRLNQSQPGFWTCSKT